MNKDFSKAKILSMNQEKQIKVLYDLASFIEQSGQEYNSNHYKKLQKYHQFLNKSEHVKIQKLNKEFIKVHSTQDYQYQVYLMNLERLLGQSKKEYDFIVNTTDHQNINLKKFPITCLLDSIRSAHNVGSMFRNAECFGSEEMILCGLTPTPESPQVQKTAMGCIEHVKWQFQKDASTAIKSFKNQGYLVYAIETAKEAIHINEVNKMDKPVVIIFGHEQFGISNELLQLCDTIIDIPMYGSKNSLNVSISQAIVLNKFCSIMD